MKVQYFDNSELSYSNRKRYNKFNFAPFNIEDYKNINLGDGSKTRLKTKSSNICNYVTIDNTRWYVLSYSYLNGGQVELNLQRDVIGEFGLNNIFGKVERGYADNIIKYRKELNLNQILKKRVPLRPDTTRYGNIFIDSTSENPHEGEMWGILYFSRSYLPVGAALELAISVASLTPPTVDFPFVENGTKDIISSSNTCKLYFDFNIHKLEDNGDTDVWNTYRATINLMYNKNNGTYSVLGSGAQVIKHNSNPAITFEINEVSPNLYQQGTSIANAIVLQIANRIANGSMSGISTPRYTFTYSASNYDYDGVTIRKDNVYYRYNLSTEVKYTYGSANFDSFFNGVYELFTNKTVNGYSNITIGFVLKGNSNTFNVSDFKYNYTERTYNVSQLSPEDAGNFTINVDRPLIDEPFVILCIPLFNTSIIDNNTSQHYTINKDNAFNLFNSIIESCSGENASLVDAQIYPYCPYITTLATAYKGTPIFNILSTSYSYRANIQLLPYSDIKKEYIKREYSIIAPDQSAKFTFNFYDYKRYSEDTRGDVNYDNLSIIIKTSLKPFSILCSAVIDRDENSLVGIGYETDLKGCSPTSNGFECTIASNAFQEYARNNSNYEKLFQNQMEEMQLSHKVEAQNDIVQNITGVAAVTAFGAIAGGNIGGIFGNIGEGIGTLIGGGGAAIGSEIAYNAQNEINKEVRAEEERLARENYNLQLGTIKNLPNQINRISTFNEILIPNFYFVVETYECTEEESLFVDTFIQNYGYSIGVYDYVLNYYKEGWFLKADIITSNYSPLLHNIAVRELEGGIYYYDNSQ